MTEPDDRDVEHDPHDDERDLDDAEVGGVPDDAPVTGDDIVDANVEGEMAPLSIDNPDVVETARRRHGGMGAALAAGMLGLDKILTGKQKPEFVQIQESPSEPVDLDKDGFQFDVDDATSVEAPPLERRAPLGVGKKKPRRR